MSKHVRYYVTGHTAKGTVHFLPQFVKDLKRVVLIDEPSLTWSTKLLQGIIEALPDEEIELFLSPSGNAYLEGIYLPKRSLAIVTRTIASFDLKLDFPNVKEIAIRDILNVEVDSGENLPELIKEYDTFIHAAYDAYNKGLRIHDDLEAIYVDEIDREKANQLAEQVVANILKGIPKQEKVAKVTQKFFGTNTPSGTVNIIPDILERMNKADFIHGRAGTGKSTLMKRVAKACVEKGLNIELYHCSFDPDSVDMVLIPSLKYCIFDATAPHAFNPTRKSESIIDTYEGFVTPGTDEKYAEDIDEVTSRYKKEVQEGSLYLKNAGTVLEEIEKPFVDQLNAFANEKERVIQHIIEKLELN